MSDIDFNMHNMPMLLSRNKSDDYQKRVIKSSTILLSFLKDNNLINIDPFNEQGYLKLDLVVKQSNLTDIGNALFVKIIPNWFKYIDKGGNAENITKLEKGLMELQKTVS
ncbi:hypothetical protein MTZ49_08860 [Entomomonas sp. E2T0]|uniref:hypothetical protein n=1 Tax=Entomomonas sp. E2T0 TaxID=2930213 RepID=UPI0022284B6A|nr:hypothetical protein [Entomomonas sp. E2T0]UYZ82726.1 hypothetical protein MTZ49_08860 [Entomomonas sp. E2T0]